jgi:hypothetical protein
VQGFQPVDGGQGAGHRPHEHQRRETGEHEVAGEQDGLVRQPGDEVAGGVRRAARVQHLDPAVTDMDGHRGVDGEVR